MAIINLKIEKALEEERQKKWWKPRVLIDKQKEEVRLAKLLTELALREQQRFLTPLEVT